MHKTTGKCQNGNRELQIVGQTTTAKVNETKRHTTGDKLMYMFCKARQPWTKKGLSLRQMEYIPGYLWHIYSATGNQAMAAIVKLSKWKFRFNHKASSCSRVTTPRQDRYILRQHMNNRFTRATETAEQTIGYQQRSISVWCHLIRNGK
jgi:hypothetical protein